MSFFCWGQSIVASSLQALLAITGAVTLTCKAALRTGQGRVWTCVINDWVDWILMKCIAVTYADTGFYLTHRAPNQITLKINPPLQPKWIKESSLPMIVLLDLVVRDSSCLFKKMHMSRPRTLHFNKLKSHFVVFLFQVLLKSQRYRNKFIMKGSSWKRDL